MPNIVSFIKVFHRPKKKIVLIIGNGFDLDLGRKTSYKDFWQQPEFCPRSYPAPIIRHLNRYSEQNPNDIRWYDLENELLKYYESFADKGIPDDIISSTERHLIERINRDDFTGVAYNEIDTLTSLITKGIVTLNQNGYPIPCCSDILESPVWRDRSGMELIKEGLCKYLNKAQTESPNENSNAYRVLSELHNLHNHSAEVRIYNFNFTKLPDRFSNLHCEYIHGSCADNNIIVGTREGIDSREYDFLEKAMQTHSSTPALSDGLQNADHIIIFGHSLGDSIELTVSNVFSHHLKISTQSAISF